MFVGVLKYIFYFFLYIYDKYLNRYLTNKNLNSKTVTRKTGHEISIEIDLAYDNAENQKKRTEKELEERLLNEHTEFLNKKFTVQQQEDYVYYISSFRRRSLLYFLSALSHVFIIGKYFRRLYLLSFTEVFWNRFNYHEILRARNQGFLKNPVEDAYLRNYGSYVIDNEFEPLRGFFTVKTPLWLRDFYNYILYLLTCRHEYYFFVM
jgi:hypothetical protein